MADWADAVIRGPYFFSFWLTATGKGTNLSAHEPAAAIRASPVTRTSSPVALRFIVPGPSLISAGTACKLFAAALSSDTESN